MPWPIARESRSFLTSDLAGVSKVLPAHRRFFDVRCGHFDARFGVASRTYGGREVGKNIFLRVPHDSA